MHSSNGGWTLVLLAVLGVPRLLCAQATGSVVGRVLVAHGSEAVAGADVSIPGTSLRTITADNGRFVLAGVPAGERSLRVERLGYRPAIVEQVLVRAGQSTRVEVRLETAPVSLPGVAVEATRVRLIEPDVSATHDVVVGRVVRSLPVDRLEQVLELTPGVSKGHFRGGRVGQEVYVVDGVELKNQLEASTQGFGLELAPSSLEEVEVITGGFGAEYGSALSGVVSYVTRRGRADRWEGRASLLSDAWAPSSLFYGFNSLSASAGGPVSFLGAGTTLYTDVLAQGMLDADPRARGLTCLQPGDADSTLAGVITSLGTAAGGRLLCPYTTTMLPHQRGDKLIAFGRLDRPLGHAARLTVTLLHNRLQRELYTPEFRYNPNYQLGQRFSGSLLTAALDWSQQRQGKAYHVVARSALMRLDRYLGALDPTTFDGRSALGGFGLSDYRFLGEDFARSPIDQQLASGSAVPGYLAPGGAIGSPYGAAAQGIFFTSGTPDIANWSRSDMLAGDLTGEYFAAGGSFLRGGTSLRLYRVESYERVLSYLPGSSPNYARFFPATLSNFADVHIADPEGISFDLGLRVEMFRAGLSFRQDRADFQSPVIDTHWRTALMPRLGLSLPLAGTDGSTALRLTYGYVAQPPDFRYFLDTTIGDSLRTSIRRQGNPNLSFEKGKSLEVGVSRLLGTHFGVNLSAYRKVLTNVVTGSLQIGDTGNPQFSTNDVGRVLGVELSGRGQWRGLVVRAGYTLQKATGVASGTDADSLIAHPSVNQQYPLAFDQRHAIDATILVGQAAGSPESPWSAALTTSLRSGYPLNRYAAVGDSLVRGSAYLPWTAVVDLRLSRDFGSLPGCHHCTWRVLGDVRNMLGLDNVLAYRGDTGGLAPTLGAVQQLVSSLPPPSSPIPAESPLYTATADLDGNGLITASEFQRARLAAAVDRFDPSLYFGEARQIRMGVEVTF